MIPLALIGGIVVVVILVIGLKQALKYLSNKDVQINQQEQNQNGNE